MKIKAEKIDNHNEIEKWKFPIYVSFPLDNFMA